MYHWEYEGTDRFGRAIWSCRREGSGFCGYGPTRREAMEAFLDIEQELVPVESYELTGLGRSDQPPELHKVAYRDPDRDYEDYRNEHPND